MPVYYTNGLINWYAVPVSTALSLALALGCCDGEDMHAPIKGIRADPVVTGARQLRAVLHEALKLPRATRGLI